MRSARIALRGSTAPLLCLLLAACACSSPAANPAPAAPEARVERTLAHAPRTSDIDVEHYALDLALEPRTRTIEGTCTVRLWPRKAGLARVELDLEGLTVRGVADGAGRALAFEHEDGVLAITLAEPLARDVPVELAIRYGGAPARGLYFVAERDGVPTQVFTQGECEDARWWFPCWDAPSDRATSEIRVRMPAGWISTAAGERVEHEDLGAQGSIDHWRMATPHSSYLTTLVAGEFERSERAWDGVPLVFLVPPGTSERAAACFDETDEILEFLGDVTGCRYPYAKYSQACVDNFPFGGMENISATTMTDEMLRDEAGLRDTPTFELVAHEAAHQWFGDLLTCADWSHIWLNEGFATYMTLLYVEATRGPDAFRAKLRDTLEGYLAADVGPRRRPTVWNVWREPMDLFFEGGQTYAGGALRLNHLRYVIGDEAFFRGLAYYVADNAGRSVVTGDLRRAMERASGADLGWFFAQWFQARGYPEFRASWSWDEEAGEVVLELEQVQSTTDGTPAVFRTPADVEMRCGEITQLVRVQVDSAAQTFRLKAPRRPEWVHFDRRGWIPKRLAMDRGTAEWLAILAGDDDVNARRDAAAAVGRALREADDEAARARLAAALRARLATDTQAPVRAQAARSLAFAEDAETLAALRRAAAGDETALVRVAALETLVPRVASPELAAFASEQYAAGFSWATRIAAARLYAAADPAGAPAWLAERLTQRSPHGELESGLLATLADREREDAAPVLLAWVADPHASPQARATAARLLGLFGRGRSGVREALLAALASDDYDLRGGAIEGLTLLRDSAAVNDLEAQARRPMDARQRRAIERALSSPWALQ